MFKKDFEDSKEDFANIVWPALEERIGGLLYHIEGYKGIPLFEKFDKSAAIDAYVANCSLGTGVYGIACRNQWGIENLYNTITIRFRRDNGLKTEHEKVSESIEKGSLFPHLYCHTYLDKRHGNIIGSPYLVWTVDLYRIVNDDFAFCKQNGRFRVISIVTNKKEDNNKFIAVDYRKFQRALVGLFDPYEETVLEANLRKLNGTPKQL